MKLFSTDLAIVNNAFSEESLEASLSDIKYTTELVRKEVQISDKNLGHCCSLCMFACLPKVSRISASVLASLRALTFMSSSAELSTTRQSVHCGMGLVSTLLYFT